MIEYAEWESVSRSYLATSDLEYKFVWVGGHWHETDTIPVGRNYRVLPVTKDQLVYLMESDSHVDFDSLIRIITRFEVMVNQNKVTMEDVGEAPDQVSEDELWDALGELRDMQRGTDGGYD